MTKNEVGVVHFGAGNIYSVLRGLKKVGAVPVVVKDPDAASRYDRLVLPGVGAFGKGMESLRDSSLAEAIIGHCEAGKPLLGICLGAQLIMDFSEEFGHHDGLGLVPGGVTRIKREDDLRIPHVGWAPLTPLVGWDGTVLSSLSGGDFVYFTHSFACQPCDEVNVLARITYGRQSLVAAVIKDNVCGVQFHPELSASAGLSILGKFTTL